MRHACSMLLLLIAGFACVPACFAMQAPERPELVDRIVARIEGDIILLSEVRELAAYQQLIDGHAQADDPLVSELIEQWVVRNEAEQAQFALPPAADVDAEIDRIRSRFANAQAFRERLAAVGLAEQALRRIVEQQIYLERYLDYKFRPAIQVQDAAISQYYQEELAPPLRAQGQTPPPLDDVREQIREVLVQRGINERADTWFEETKSRLQIEIAPTLTGDRKP
jgi:hypothetical protein